MRIPGGLQDSPEQGKPSQHALSQAASSSSDQDGLSTGCGHVVLCLQVDGGGRIIDVGGCQGWHGYFFFSNAWGRQVMWKVVIAVGD